MKRSKLILNGAAVVVALTGAFAFTNHFSDANLWTLQPNQHCTQIQCASTDVEGTLTPCPDLNAKFLNNKCTIPFTGTGFFVEQQ
ncbi:MAG TPA: DUF6520 family protein [Puia sp.]|jgi:hypothetical protein|nr:DUF6520 family protein [Puia sp.]